jgi:phage-related protein
MPRRQDGRHDGHVARRRKRERAAPKRRWRDYRTRGGSRPVKDFLDKLSDADVADILAAMAEVQKRGIQAAKQIEGDLFEVKAEGDRQTFRILFSQEGKHDQVLLALVGLSKKQQKLPRDAINLAKSRLRDWRSRGRERR